MNGLVVPHAGYAYSGKVAGQAYSLLKNQKINKIIIFGPSHYEHFKGIASLENIETPLGKVNISKNFFQKLKYEHSVMNQIPFLQKLFHHAEVLPIVVGEITEKESKQIAEQFSKENALFVFSTDLSHFLSYDNATKKDKKTIEIIEKLNLKRLKEIDACGIFPLMILMNLCRIKNWKPELIEYKNSGDITGDKSSVVGYASLKF